MTLAHELKKIDEDRYTAAFQAVVSKGSENKTEHEAQAAYVLMARYSPGLCNFVGELLSGNIVTESEDGDHATAAFHAGVLATIIALAEYADADEVAAMLPSITD